MYSRSIPLSLILALTSLNASAQSANPGFDPSQPARRFETIEREERRAAARISLPKPAIATSVSPASDDKKILVLRRIDVAGATVISSHEIAETYQAHIGKRVSRADLSKIAGLITDRYRNAGYHLSRAIIPAQDINAGHVRINVIEGSITKIVLKGDDAERFVGRLLDPIIAEQPSRQQSLERQLLNLNDRAGLRIVDTSLEEIGLGTGSFRLIITLRTAPIVVSSSIDNLGASSVGPWQTYATAAFNSYLATGDSLALNISTVPDDPRQLVFGRISYDVPVGTSGASFGASVIHSEVRPNDWRKEFGDVTKTEGVEIRGSIMPIQSQSSTLTLTAAAAINNVSERDVIGEIYNDKLRIVSATADYRIKDGLGGTNYLTATVRQGLDVFGASRPEDDLLSRFNGSGTFTAANIWFTRYQTLNDSWSVKTAAAAQYASRELLISQQYYLGGASFGRGYSSATISGDNAIAGSVELRYDAGWSWRSLKRIQLYGFIEGGTVWNVDEKFSEGPSLASAGGGVRFFLWDDLKLDVGVGFPLSYRPSDNYSRNPRLLFSVSNSLKLCPARGSVCS